ncbi:MAG: hypothetical protein EPN48_09530 [Microbacteriaceae bacterium]|nr:MAG: hypothetical protein EPN48_09530 [Microbacteriaceae bacterium]
MSKPVQDKRRRPRGGYKGDLRVGVDVLRAGDPDRVETLGPRAGYDFIERPEDRTLDALSRARRTGER